MESLKSELRKGVDLSSGINNLLLPNLVLGGGGGAPNLPNLPTKIKHVRVRSVAPLVMEDGGCSLIFAKVIDMHIIEVATKSSCIAHPPNHGDCTVD